MNNVRISNESSEWKFLKKDQGYSKENSRRKIGIFRNFLESLWESWENSLKNLKKNLRKSLEESGKFIGKLWKPIGKFIGKFEKMSRKFYENFRELRVARIIRIHLNFSPIFQKIRNIWKKFGKHGKNSEHWKKIRNNWKIRNLWKNSGILKFSKTNP